MEGQQMKPSGWYEEDDFLGPVRPARLSRLALFDAKDDDDWDDDISDGFNG